MTKLSLNTLKRWLAHKNRTRPCTMVIAHSTVSGKSAGTIEWLRHIGYSYHFLIDKDGKVTKCVPLSQVAFHAGKSMGPHGPNVNEYSVGIAFVNWNDGKDKITEAQMAAFDELVMQIDRQFSIVWIATHHGISPKRKTDPKLFDPRPVAKRLGMEAYRGYGAAWVTT